MRTCFICTIVFLIMPAMILAQSELPAKYILDPDIDGNVYFSRDTVYILTYAVYVEAGESLTIESGTVILSYESYVSDLHGSDIDGDGDLDLAAPSENLNSLILMTNDNGVFTVAHQLT